MNNLHAPDQRHVPLKIVNGMRQKGSMCHLFWLAPHM